MKSYPHLEYYGDYWGLPIIAFDKLDGSNMRFEFSKKRGFYKAGTRNQMIDAKSEPFGFAIELFENKYGASLRHIFTTDKDYRNIESFVLYAELKAPDSAFGQHDFSDLSKFDIVLFDIDQHKKGFIPPRQFIKDFAHLGIPRLVYDGPMNKQLVLDVKANKFDLEEGVIVKGLTGKGHSNAGFYYAKIKTDDWFKRLRSFDEKQYDREVKENKNKEV